jgi:stage V sporulation protein T
MRATGIVRRIDDLGRLVVPKEIRRAFQVKEGDPFEIFTDGEYICFKKYSNAPELKDTLERLHKLIYEDEIIAGLPTEQSASIKALLHVLERDIDEYVFTEEDEE